MEKDKKDIDGYQPTESLDEKNPPNKKSKEKKQKDFFSNEVGIDLTAAIVFHIDKMPGGLKVLTELNYKTLDSLMGGFSEIETGKKKYKLKTRKTSSKGIELEYQEVK